MKMKCNNIDTILKIIKEKYESGKYNKFNFKVEMSVDEVPIIEFETKEYGIKDKTEDE